MTNGTYVSVTIVGRNTLFRRGLASLLVETNFRVVEEAEDVNRIALHDGHPKRDLILLDASTRHADLAADVGTLISLAPGVPVIVLSEELEHQALLNAMAAGASGYLLTDISAEALVSSLTLVMLGEKVFPSVMSTLLINGVLTAPQPVASNVKLRELSVREAQILPHLVAGEPNKVIARRLHVTEATVKVHMKSLMRKIGTANRTQAAIWALNHGISGDPDDISEEKDGPGAPVLWSECRTAG